MKRYAVLSLSLIASIVLITNCGGGGSSGSVVLLGDVVPYFPNNGVNWNDYVKNDQASIYTATDTAATGTETGSYFDAVIHGGEMRALPIPDRSTCPGLSAYDDLGAFDWACVEIGGNVQMVSTGLADGKYLSDLIDFGTGQWRENSVTVLSGGSTYGYSTTTVWWGNPIYEDNDAGALSTEGAVYIATADPHALYTISAHKVALVVEPGVTISGPGLSQAVIFASGQVVDSDFLWVEGAVDSVNDNMGIQWIQIRFGVIRGAKVEHAIIAGVYDRYSNGNRLSDISVPDNTRGLEVNECSLTSVANIRAVGNEEGIEVTAGSSGIRLTNVAAARNENMGIRLENSSNLFLSNIKVYNNGAFGIYMSGNSDSVLSNLVVANNYNNGIFSASSPNSVIMNVTSVNNGADGVRFDAAHNQTMLGISAAGNNYRGISIEGSDDILAADLDATDNESNGLLLANSDNSLFTGLLKVGNNGLDDCNVSGGVNEGLINQSCLNSGSSDAVLSTGVTSVASFVGKVITDDSVNLSDTDGSAPFNNISDWTGFENVYRTWGRDGAAFASTTNQGYADSTEVCRIWDWSLAGTGDTGDNGGPVLLDVMTLPTGDDTVSHAWAGTSTVSTFLSSAVEIPDDRVGNDNLLCESGEDCQYLPNIGAYQGHGSLVSAGSLTPGVITDVSLFEYSTNGR